MLSLLTYSYARYLAGVRHGDNDVTADIVELVQILVNYGGNVEECNAVRPLTTSQIKNLN